MLRADDIPFRLSVVGQQFSEIPGKLYHSWLKIFASEQYIVFLIDFAHEFSFPFFQTLCNTLHTLSGITWAISDSFPPRRRISLCSKTRMSSCPQRFTNFSALRCKIFFAFWFLIFFIFFEFFLNFFLFFFFGFFLDFFGFFKNHF